MSRRFEVLLAPPVLGALVLLLANDFVLKPAFHNALTGKLSDFAGLFVFAVFGCAVFPRHRGSVGLLTATGFVLWKSPAAQPLIDAWNALGLFPVARVVDPTDLAALLVIPLACLHRPRLPARVPARRLLAPVAGAACVFAFAATSYAPHMVPMAVADYPLPLSRGEVLRRMYDLRLSFQDWGVPPKEGAEGPDRVQIQLPPADARGEALDQVWRSVTVGVEVRDAPGGGSELTLLSGSSHDRKRLAPDAVRAGFERLVVERLRRNEPNPVHAPELVVGTEPRLDPRIVAPISLAEPRARVTIRLARPASVAIVEVTPDDRWHLLYPVRPEDERILPAGTHTLATACANEPAAAPLPPDAAVPPCAVARPVTPREVAAGGVHPGMLAMIATDVVLRREVVRAQAEGYSGFTHFYSPDFSPLVKARPRLRRAQVDRRGDLPPAVRGAPKTADFIPNLEKQQVSRGDAETQRELREDSETVSFPLAVLSASPRLCVRPILLPDLVSHRGAQRGTEVTGEK